MYMPAPHNHAEWQERKTDGNTTQKEYNKTWDAEKRKATDSNPPLK